MAISQLYALWATTMHQHLATTVAYWHCLLTKLGLLGTEDACMYKDGVELGVPSIGARLNLIGSCSIRYTILSDICGAVNCFSVLRKPLNVAVLGVYINNF
jgi:hypothetical protein